MRIIYFMLSSIFCLLAFCEGVNAQKWISLNGSPHGEAFTMTVIEDSPSAYAVKIEINGLYDIPVTNNHGDFHQLSLVLSGFLNDEGKPSLPILSRLIAIPSGATASASIEEGEWKDVEVGKILPAQAYRDGNTATSVFDIDESFNGGNITINTSINDGYDISISSEDGDLIDNIYSSTSSCTFTKPSGNFWLSVHKHNYIPYVIYYNTDAEYIQNVTFNYDAYYNSTPLIIGDGVTGDITAGDVIVKSGNKLVLKNGTGGVYIDAGFECEGGALFEIK